MREVCQKILISIASLICPARAIVMRDLSPPWLSHASTSCVGESLGTRLN